MSTKPSLSRTERTTHRPALDGLRGIAILAVLMHHFMTPRYPEGIPGGVHGIVIKSIYRLFDVGWWGVDLFFVLSGFLITGILLDAKGSGGFFRNFYARRSLRIFPLYYGVLGVLFIVLPILATFPACRAILTQSDTFALTRAVASKQAWLWLYGTNIKTAIDATGWTFGFLTLFWSLAVEEHFYLIWPLVIYFCPSKTLVWVCIGTALASVVVRAGCLAAGMAPAYVFVLTPCRLDGLTLGALMATLARRPGGIESLVAPASRVLKYIGPLALLALLTLNRFGLFMSVFGYALLAIVFAAIMPCAASISSGGGALGWLCHPWLRLLGKYSYGIYVLHLFILDAVDKVVCSTRYRAVVGPSYEVFAVSRIGLSLLGAVGLGTLSYHLYEKHFLRLKVFFPAGASLRRGVEAPPNALRAAPPSGNADLPLV